MGKISFVNLYYGQIVFAFLVLLLFGSFGAIYQYRKHSYADKKWWREPSHPRVGYALLLTMYALYSELTAQSLRMLNCSSDIFEGKETLFLTIEPSTQCFGEKHLPASLLAIMIMMAAVCLPIFVLCRLRNARKKGLLHSREIEKTYGT